MLVPLHQLSILLSMTLRCPQSRFAFPYFDRLNSVAWVNPNGAPQFSPVVSAWLVLRALLWGISPLPSARSLCAITALVALGARSLQRITTWRAHFLQAWCVGDDVNEVDSASLSPCACSFAGRFGLCSWGICHGHELDRTVYGRQV